MTHQTRNLLRRLATRRAAASMEFALVFPVLLLFILGMFAVVSLVLSKRAMDVGVERALRYAIVNGNGGTANVTSIYAQRAKTIWPGVATASAVTITPSNFAAGDRVTVTATFQWSAPARLFGSVANPIFNPITLTSTATMRAMH